MRLDYWNFFPYKSFYFLINILTNYNNSNFFFWGCKFYWWLNGAFINRARMHYVPYYHGNMCNYVKWPFYVQCIYLSRTSSCTCNRTIYNCSYLSFCYVKIQYIKLNKPVFSVPELPPKDLASAQGHQGHDLHPCVGTLTAISKQRGDL